MNLHEFKSQLSGQDEKKPPYAIRAKDLDDNFSKCAPQMLDGNNHPYRVIRAANNNWRLEGTRIFDVCENGVPVKYRMFAEKLEAQPL